MSEAAQLPAPMGAFWDWQLAGACRGLDAAVFFHPDNERGHSKRRREARAKAICVDCPVRRQCLGWALRTREPYGIWGGTSPAEREQILAAVDGRLIT